MSGSSFAEMAGITDEDAALKDVAGGGESIGSILLP
jgi:hypothetical protein